MGTDALRLVATKFLSTLSLRRATQFVGAESGYKIFLSTLSLRRATHHLSTYRHQGQHFYPRSPCGERLHREQRTEFYAHFYPRSPCGERQNDCGRSWRKQSFLSTLSLRRATEREPALSQSSEISIHALLAESDLQQWILVLSALQISIHALLAESDFGRAFWPGLSL